MQNTGGAFSIGSNSLTQIIIINLIIIGMVAKFLISQFNKMSKLSKYTLCLILAGGISNLIDRIIRGFVIDYINLEEFIKFPIFNLADIYIVIGWTVLVVTTIIYAIKNKKIVNN